jgi:hypothetical protein
VNSHGVGDNSLRMRALFLFHNTNYKQLARICGLCPEKQGYWRHKTGQSPHLLLKCCIIMYRNRITGLQPTPGQSRTFLPCEPGCHHCLRSDIDYEYEKTELAHEKNFKNLIPYVLKVQYYFGIINTE